MEIGMENLPDSNLEPVLMNKAIATAIAIVRAPSVSLCTFQPCFRLSFRSLLLLSFQNIKYYVVHCIPKPEWQQLQAVK